MLKKRLHFDMPRESVTEILAGFPDRYRCHRTKKYKGEWQCKLLKRDRSRMVFQMIDQTFDVTKGNAKSESPLITVEINDSEENSSVMDISLKWQKDVTLLTYLLSFLYLLVGGYAIADRLWALLVPVVVLTVLHLCRIWRYRRYDRLRMDVFTDILIKNFDK